MNPAEPDPAAGGAPLDRVPAEVTRPAPETTPAATETFPLPEPEQLGKHLLELPVATDADGLATVSGGGGAADALSRP